MKINAIIIGNHIPKHNTHFQLFSFKGQAASEDVFLPNKKTAREKQLSGEFYCADKELHELKIKSGKCMQEFNATYDYGKREDIMKQWFKSVGKNCAVAGNFFCDYGKNLTLGDKVFINNGCTILDSNEVIIGDNTLIGPRVTICAASHSLIPEERLKKDNIYGEKITIGKNCWIGAGAIILGGVTIGDGTTIGAGSVVTKNIPERSVAYGVPCQTHYTIPKYDKSQKQDITVK